MRGFVRGDDLSGLADKLYADLEPQLLAAVDDGSALLLAEVQSQLSRVGPPIPGAAPAYVTGDLFRSWRVVPARKKGSRIAGGVISENPEAGRLEFGGEDKTGDVLPPHPYARPAKAKARPKFLARLDEL